MKPFHFLLAAAMFMMLSVALGDNRETQGNSEHELIMLRRQVEFQNKELQQARSRLIELRRSVQQAVATLKAKGKEGGTDTIVAALERAAAAAAPGEETTGSARGSTSKATPGDSAGAAGMRESSSAASTPPAAPGPAPAPTASPTDFHIPGFAFSKVVFKDTGQGMACTGRVANRAMKDEVISAPFNLITYDAQGAELERVVFYLVFSEMDQTKTFSVPVKQTPPTGRFKIERVEKTEPQ